jgi:eukaryotic-like serine/threonine-protein kinase
VLARLDRRRSRAYAEPEPRLLAGVYCPGSAVLGRDRSLLRRYASRGLRVRGLRTSVVDLDVRRRARRTVVLAVDDRVAGGTVLGPGVRRPLPADDADRWLVTLRWRPRQGWRIAAVRLA